jgi:hypothetical protein
MVRAIGARFLSDCAIANGSLIGDHDRPNADTTATGSPVDHQHPGRRTALIAGLWFAGTFLFSIPAGLLYDPILTDADYILGEGSVTRIEIGAFLEILLAVSGIATAVVFYPVLKRQNEAVALGYIGARTVEGIIILAGVVAVLSVVTLRHDIGGPGPPTPRRWRSPADRWFRSTNGRASSARSSALGSETGSCWAI